MKKKKVFLLPSPSGPLLQLRCVPHLKEKMRGTPVIVPHKPGVDEWWQKCRRQGTVDLEGLEEGEKGFLPDRLLKCMKGTSKLSQMLGKKNKRQEEGEEK